MTGTFGEYYSVQFLLECSFFPLLADDTCTRMQSTAAYGFHTVDLDDW